MRNLLDKHEIDADLEEELESYATMLADERVAGGISRSEARRSTLAELGGIEHIKGAGLHRVSGNSARSAGLGGCCPGDAAGIVATWIPAQRALGVNHLILLREE